MKNRLFRFSICFVMTLIMFAGHSLVNAKAAEIHFYVSNDGEKTSKADTSKSGKYVGVSTSYFDEMTCLEQNLYLVDHKYVINETYDWLACDCSVELFLALHGINSCVRGLDINWYVLKYDSSDCFWHVDGYIVNGSTNDDIDEDPVDEDPVDEDPVDEDPADEDPADEDPIVSDPVDEDPVDEEPVDEEPADEEPADEEPADEEPVDEEPVDEEPADEEPADEEPVDEEPVDEEPIDEEPVDEEPVDEEPVEEEIIEDDNTPKSNPVIDEDNDREPAAGDKEDDSVEEILDDEIPQADPVPGTGDNSVTLYVAFCAALMFLCMAIVSRKRVMHNN